MNVAFISILGLTAILLVFLGGTVYLLFTIKQLLYQISGTLDSIERNGQSLPLILPANPKLLQVTRTLRVLNRELKRYIKRD